MKKLEAKYNIGQEVYVIPLSLNYIGRGFKTKRLIQGYVYRLLITGINFYMNPAIINDTLYVYCGKDSKGKEFYFRDSQVCKSLKDAERKLKKYYLLLVNRNIYETRTGKEMVMDEEWIKNISE